MAIRKTISSDRKARAQERTRLDILEAAARACSRKGLLAATMQEIAREAGFTAPSLYGYFRSKDQIFTGVIEQLRHEFLGAFDEPLPAGLAFRQKLEWLARKQLELSDQRRDLLFLFVSMKHLGAVPGRFDRDAGPMLYARRLAGWIRANARPEELGGCAPDDAAHLLVGLGQQFPDFGGCQAGQPLALFGQRHPLFGKPANQPQPEQVLLAVEGSLAPGAGAGQQPLVDVIADRPDREIHPLGQFLDRQSATHLRLTEIIHSASDTVNS
jgi:AcrR family transcriptional regulator